MPQKEATIAQIHEKSTKKTKNRTGGKGSQSSTNSRKIHEKKTKNRTTVKGMQSSANPRKINEKNEKFYPSKRSTPMGRKINATNPGPRKILEKTKKTKIFRGPRKIHEKSQITSRKRTKNKFSC